MRKYLNNKQTKKSIQWFTIDSIHKFNRTGFLIVQLLWRTTPPHPSHALTPSSPSPPCPSLTPMRSSPSPPCPSLTSEPLHTSNNCKRWIGLNLSPRAVWTWVHLTNPSFPGNNSVMTPIFHNNLGVLSSWMSTSEPMEGVHVYNPARTSRKTGQIFRTPLSPEGLRALIHDTSQGRQRMRWDWFLLRVKGLLIGCSTEEEVSRSQRIYRFRGVANKGDWPQIDTTPRFQLTLPPAPTYRLSWHQCFSSGGAWQMVWGTSTNHPTRGHGEGWISTWDLLHPAQTWVLPTSQIFWHYQS